MTEKEHPHLFTPEVGKDYRGREGGRYRCIVPIFTGRAIMVNTLSNWTFTAWGLRRYEDGTIVWDYSTAKTN